MFGLSVMVLAIAFTLAGGLRALSAQSGQPGTVPSVGRHEEGALLAPAQRFPSTFGVATRIPFSVGNPPECGDGGRRYRVSLKVYNLLAQLVAVPVLADGVSSSPVGQSTQGLDLSCGQYTAYWDGSGLGGGRAVASGVYLYRLEINGRPVAARKVLVQH